MVVSPLRGYSSAGDGNLFEHPEGIISSLTVDYETSFGWEDQNFIREGPSERPSVGPAHRSPCVPYFKGFAMTSM